MPDPEYWKQIPYEARQIPADWSRIPVFRFTNTEIGGAREVRLHQTANYDLWILTDRTQKMNACMSVERATKRVYFMELARRSRGEWGLQVARDNCYSCHPSGPRVIRPLDEPGLDYRTLERFNCRLLSYGACDFGDSIDQTSRGGANTDSRCASCHDGIRRGLLYDFHQRVIRFKTERDRNMPPV